MYGLSNEEPDIDLRWVLKVKGHGQTEKNFEVEYLENDTR